MAELYLARLSQIVDRLEPISGGDLTLETRHFFSGAALYANGKICATLGPAGFALKLPAEKRSSLIEEERGQEFHFFPEGPVKREYIALSDAIIQDEEKLRELISLSANFVSA